MNPTENNVTSISSVSALIVDDDMFMLEITHEMLKEFGVGSIVMAKGGPEGLKQLDSKIKPNLVLIDLHMPKTDGFQFMEELSKRQYLGAIILISGQTSQILYSAQLMAKFHNLSILAAFEKPVDKTALLTAIQKML
jgi:CheY-like chemotaxis protein